MVPVVVRRGRSSLPLLLGTSHRVPRDHGTRQMQETSASTAASIPHPQSEGLPSLTRASAASESGRAVRFITSQTLGTGTFSTRISEPSLRDLNSTPLCSKQLVNRASEVLILPGLAPGSGPTGAPTPKRPRFPSLRRSCPHGCGR